MSETVQCPTLKDFTNATQCVENFAGLGTTIYAFDKNDLSAVLTQTDGEYSTPAFAKGKGLVKIDCKEDTVGIKGSSLGKKKGFSLELSFTLDTVNKEAAALLRAMNNIDIAFIVKDGDVSQIMYSPNYKAVADSGGIASDTGQKADDDRQTTVTFKLQPVKFINEYVKEPVAEGGWDTLLASAIAGE